MSSPEERGIPDQSFGRNAGNLEMSERELTEVKDLVQRISSLSDKQKSAIAEYLQTGIMPGQPSEESKSKKESKQSLRTQRDLERMYPNIKFYLAGGDLMEDGPQIKKISAALRIVETQLGGDKFHKLRLSFLDISSEPHILDGALQIGLFGTRTPEDFASQILNHAHSAIAEAERLGL